MYAKEVKEYGFRDSVSLGHEGFSLLVNGEMGMVPQLNCRKGDSWINAHWQPLFRANSGISWNREEHEAFWKVPLLYNIAGNFPCCPNFGPGHHAAGYEMPPHGFTALSTWTLKELKAEDEYAFARWSLADSRHPFLYEKIDLLPRGDYTHYTSLKITNSGDKPEPYNYGWHNTVGAPFLEKGCLVDNNASSFAVPGEGTEFDITGRLAFGCECESMKTVPTRDGKTADLSSVPGVIGYTDFLAAAVPSDCRIGWTSIVNPGQKLLYLSYFTGPEQVKEGEMPLYFYNYWMNYGGRPFQPWAPIEGGVDQSFCLGAENSISHFANGLASSLDNPRLLGHPTYRVLQPGETTVLNYATLFLPYEANLLDKGVKNVDCEEDRIILEGEGGYMKVHSQSDFSLLKSLEAAK